MNTIPWYRSPVFTLGLTAALVQLGAMLDAAFIESLIAGKAGALTQLGGFILSAVVVGVRAVATAQPITLTQTRADAANVPAKQGGFARPLMLAFLLATAVIAMPIMQGCTALGLQQPETFRGSYAYALGQTTALRTAAAAALNERQISIKDAEYVLQVTDQSRAYLDTARQVFEAGQTLEGKRQLELATAVLLQLQSYLNSRAPLSARAPR